MWKSLDTEYEFPAYHTSEIIYDEIFLFGGWYGDKATNELTRFSPKTYEYKCLNDLCGLPPSARFKHASCVYNQKMYIQGGTDGYSDYNDLYFFDPYKYTWESILDEGDIPTPRSGHKMVESRGMIYLFGGCENTHTYKNDLYVLSIKSTNWRKLPSNDSIEPIANFSMCISSDNNILIFGGDCDNGINNSLYIFNTLNESWDIIVNTSFPNLHYHSMLNVMSNYYLVGVSLYESENKIYKLNMDLNNKRVKFEELHSSSVSCRIGQSSIVYNTNEIHCMGGENNKFFFSNVYIFDVLMYEVKEIENNIIIPQYRSNMKYLINNKDEMSDIAFKLKDNKLVYSHKLILQTQCDYFNGLFHSGMAESNKSVLEYDDIDSKTFLSLLEYIYTGSINDESDYTVELLTIANRFSCSALEKICSYYLCKKVDENTVCSLFLSCYGRGLPILEKYCYNYLLTNIEKISKTKDFELLGNYPELLLEITRKTVSK